jgi:hypothetical protein
MRGSPSILCFLLLALACFAGPASAGSCCSRYAAVGEMRSSRGSPAAGLAAVEWHGCAPDCTGCGCGCRPRRP